MIISPEANKLLLQERSMEGTGTIVGNSTGCTANVVLITPDKYIVANAGDSRSSLCRKGKALDLSEDHKP